MILTGNQKNCSTAQNIEIELWAYAGPLQVPVDLVIDHSVQVDVARSANALQKNMELEFSRNKERFAFLKWGATAFQNMQVIPPGSGIVHQVSFHAYAKIFADCLLFLNTKELQIFCRE